MKKSGSYEENFTNKLVIFRFFDLEWVWRGIPKQAIKGVGYIIIIELMPILGN
jgi:hypothetical protein